MNGCWIIFILVSIGIIVVFILGAYQSSDCYLMDHEHIINDEPIIKNAEKPTYLDVIYCPYCQGRLDYKDNKFKQYCPKCGERVNYGINKY